MSTTRTYMAFGYVVVALLVWAMFTGEIYRGEIPFWILSGLEREAAKTGTGTSDLVLAFVLYLIYYSSLFLLPYACLRIFLHAAPASLLRSTRELSAVTAAWLALSFVLYREVLFSLVRIMFTSSASEWLALLWLAASACVVHVWWNYIRGLGRPGGIPLN